MSNEKANARAARYRRRRRERIGEEADKKRAAEATARTLRLHRNTRNERRRERAARDAQQIARLRGKGKIDKRASGICVVGSNAIRHDLTHWIGPGCIHEIALEKQADKILRDAAAKESQCPTP